MRSLELICLEVFDEDLFLWLNLQQLEEKAHKLSRLLVPINTPDRPKFDSKIDQALRCSALVMSSRVEYGNLWNLPVNAKQCSFQ